MKLARLALVVGACAIGVAACATTPTQDELTEAILVATNAEPNVELTSEQAACIAAELLNSGLSDTTLSGLAEDFDNPEVLETEVDDVEPLVTAAALACG